MCHAGSSTKCYAQGALSSPAGIQFKDCLLPRAPAPKAREMLITATIMMYMVRMKYSGVCTAQLAHHDAARQAGGVGT